ncbi:hypothetical protein CPB84DRAFT_86798 [Gymnopilus junonius]|uniref:Uncharacterized protein n=1 Tax=Gymnopilus junonius TaxID=109634 RepID=A0A9P5P2V1_GYMJU|nr:hypothetical protein CPB84DRAFT_86798 [Gymnopilus junonius]
MDHRQGSTVFRPLLWRDTEGGEPPDISKIRGNISDEAKRYCLRIFDFHVSTPGNSYGADVGGCLRLVEINVQPGRENTTFAETVFEVTIRKDMCNIFRILHGACAAYIVDLCSVSALVALGTALGFDATGVSQSMNLIWHHPIRLEENVKVISMSMSVKEKVRTMRCEVSIRS